ncbi:ABCB family ABC transporter ATP-binding protein/permease [Arenibaculum pallidiluteum]|uniref:ABCB family ABC transporter ATP-binding protein/permease n=1 Tax=Arenibaculum pallidiluteum TaxID=2812559 RepID=UPI001A97B4BD|nr:ABC transporter ATP-binding protein/permease [Arenibaculum pallidiluteum]
MADSAAGTPRPDALPQFGEGRAVRALLPYLWPAGQWGLRSRVVVALACLVVAKLANVYVPVLYKHAVDALSGGAGLVVAVPLGVILAYGLARVTALGFGELRDAIFAKVAQRAIRSVALNVFRHLHALSLRFHLERQTGGLSRSIERGTRAIQTLLSFMLFNILPTLLEILLVCGILWGLFDVWFALATFVTVVAYIAYTLAITEWRLKFRREMNEQDNRANTKAIDSLLNFETVKYFGNEEHEARRYDSALQSYETAAVKSQVSLSLLNIGQAAIIAAGLTAVMWMAARGIANGTMTVGDFVLVNTYLLQLYQPLNFFGFVYREIKQALIDMEKMFELMGVDREVADRPGAADLATAGGTVAFEDVAFGYDPRRPILKGVSFTVPAGRTVAIVGPSGAGKSTVSRLLFRFYDVSGGRILIDGQDIRDVTQKSLRGAIGIVPQDTVLFNDTIYYNIAYGRPSASPAEVEQAARLAHIHDFVMALPDGYQTTVGERGLKLSGGEKQRVAIARAILKAPAILLFDEATSALDTRTEREIQSSLREVSRGRTTLVIAHRLSTVIDADEILVLEQGRVAERGSHGELLAMGGRYAAMWHQQQQAAEAGEAPPRPEDGAVASVMAPG